MDHSPALELLFCDGNADVIAALSEAVGSTAQFSCGYFETHLPFDALVVPGNSSGLMGGGLDLAVRHFFGDAIQVRLQKQIQEFHALRGVTENTMLPVGEAVLVPTEDVRCAWMLYAPTMEYPRSIEGTDYPYRAMRAVLRLWQSHNAAAPDRAIRTLVCPGLGTGTGRIHPQESAAQIKRAICDSWKEELGPLRPRPLATDISLNLRSF